MKASTVVWKSLAVAAICFFTPPNGSQALGPINSSRNLLKNGWFERGLEGWRFEAWKDNQARVVVDPAVTHHGRPSIRIDHPTITDSSLTQVLDLKPDRRYRLSGWIKTQNVVKAPLDYQRKGDEGASIGILGGYEKSPSVLFTEDWVYRTMEFRTKKDKTQIRLGPRLGHYGKKVTGTAWFAEMTLEEIGR